MRGRPLAGFVLAVLVTLGFADRAARADARLVDGERRVPINGVAHWYRVAGAARHTVPIVVVHGGPGGNDYNFERTVGPRLEAFATVIYYEQRGSGRSAAPADANAYSLPILVADLEALRAHLGVERMALLGFSFGGELALEYALAHPDHVAKLMVQAPGIGDRDRSAMVQLASFDLVATPEERARIRAIAAEPKLDLHQKLGRVWDLVSTATVDRLLFQSPEMAKLNRELWKQSGLLNSGQMSRALDRQPPRTPPLRDAARTLQVPTLVLVGVYDRNLGVDQNRDLALVLPRARLVLFDHSAHFPDIEEPEAYARAVRAFLAAP